MRKIVSILISLLFLIAFTIQIVELRVYDRSFYKKQYHVLQTYESIGISEDDLMQTTDVLLSYMERNRDDMVIYATIYGKNREVFNEREKQHMVDVVYLLKICDYVKYCGFGLYALLIILSLCKKQMKELGKNNLIAIGVFGVFLGCVAIFCAIDFDAFWTLFHQVLFRNDLWLLDPTTSIMINMFPLEFFNTLVVQIVVLAIICIGLFGSVSFYLIKKKEKAVA